MIQSTTLYTLNLETHVFGILFGGALGYPQPCGPVPRAPLFERFLLVPSDWEVPKTRAILGVLIARTMQLGS